MDGNDFQHDREFSVGDLAGGDFIDIPGDVSTTTVLAPGGSLNDQLETAFDSDYVRINLVAGQAYNFTLNASGGTPVGNPLLELRDAAGNLLWTNDDFLRPSTNSRIGFVAQTTGSYYLVARSADGGTGTYTLAASAAATPLPVYNYNQIASYLTDGSWNATGEQRHAFNTGTVTVNITGINADAKILAQNALRIWGEVTGINFQETAGAAQITFGQTQTGAFATYVAQGTVTTTAAVNVGPQWLVDSGNTIGTYGFQTYLHEIGHTLGLGHGGNYNGTADYRVSSSFAGDNHYLNDSWQASLMSYMPTGTGNTYVNATQALVVGPMVADIIAIQSLYGTPTNTRTGDTTYGFNNTSDAVYNFANYAQGTMVAFAIFDSGGTDTLDASGFTANQLINLNPGMYSNIGGMVGNIGIATNTLVENAVGGSGNDTILGSGVANLIRAGAGFDFISGDAGNDIIFGGDNFDTVSYYYGTGSIFDLTTGFITDGQGGTDAVDQVEQFWGSGYYGDRFTGNANANTFNGFGGNDYVNAGDQGADTYIGGDGFDTIGFYNSFGAIVNLGNGTAVDGSLGTGQGSTDIISGFEEVYGSNGFADTIVGDANNNSFYGFGGNDVLVGGGGADRLTGGAGNDYFGYNLADFQAGVWDVITDFSEAAGNRDILYFAGVAPQQVIFGEANGGVYVSITALGGNGGFFIAGATQIMISDQLLFA